MFSMQLMTFLDAVLALSAPVQQSQMGLKAHKKD